MELSAAPAERLARARLSLDGLSIGDAFGERFFTHPDLVRELIRQRAIPRAPWRYTDDTEMALGIDEVLRRHGAIDQEDLAATFGRRYAADPARGYGGTAHEILSAFRDPTLARSEWRAISGAVFDGGGSMGNGAAMRVAPLGAYFADDLARAASEARRSAEVTHLHPEGIAGAIAVAIAAALAAARAEVADIWAAVLAYTPDGETRAGIARAAALPFDSEMQAAEAERARSPRSGRSQMQAAEAERARSPRSGRSQMQAAEAERARSPQSGRSQMQAAEAERARSPQIDRAAAELGTGQRVIAQDTVPFALWCALRHGGDFEAALWTTVAGLGDRDTTCAIAGGIVALSADPRTIPEAWRAAREPLGLEDPPPPPRS